MSCTSPFFLCTLCYIVLRMDLRYIFINNEAMLTTQNLTFEYNNQQQFKFPNIVCKKGEHWLIIGQSGCGKTTLLHLLGGLLKPTGGEIAINQRAIQALKETELDKFRGENIGIVFQQSHLIKALTVEENLLTTQYLAGVPQDKEHIKTILTKLNLGDKLKSKPHNLSLGEQQRVSIARALVNNPVLILADEPTSSLDDDNCKEVVDLLLEQSKEQNATLLIVTHDGRLKELFENQIHLTKESVAGSTVG